MPDVYAPGPKKKITLRPIDARIALPAGKFCYLYEEFAQHFCVEQAFATGAERLGTIFGTAPQFKYLCGCFNRPVEEDGEELSGILDTFRWLREQAEQRRLGVTHWSFLPAAIRSSME